MARKTESVHQFERDPKYRLTKEKTVVRCDDGAVYEFERPKDEPLARLVVGFQPDGSKTHTGKRMPRLPDAVEETVETLLGGWSK
jgi:hypothetical protein